jgi:HSP20 family molecular chaperone IbpA
MHLDDWFAPDELIGTAAAAATRGTIVQVEGKPVFEVKLNVSDFKPEELKVKVNEEDRSLTIEGTHHEYHGDANADEEHGGHGRHGHVTRRDSLHTHFKRSLTLPKSVLHKKMQCRLTADGQQLILSAPVKVTPISPAAPAHRVKA